MATVAAHVTTGMQSCVQLLREKGWAVEQLPVEDISTDEAVQLKPQPYLGFEGRSDIDKFQRLTRPVRSLVRHVSSVSLAVLLGACCLYRSALPVVFNQVGGLIGLAALRSLVNNYHARNIPLKVRVACISANALLFVGQALLLYQCSKALING